MGADFTDIDNDAPESETEVCECGQVHDGPLGLGQEFYTFAEQYGPESPMVQAVVANELAQLGIEPIGVDDDPEMVGYPMAPDQLRSVIAELAFPWADRPRADWGTEEGQRAYLSSAYLAHQIVMALKDISLLLAAVHRSPDLGIHPAHVAAVVDGFEQGAIAANSLALYATSVLQPDANVDLSVMADNDDIVEPVDVVGIADAFDCSRFEDYVEAQYQEAVILADRVTRRFDELSDEGLDHSEALRIVREEFEPKFEPQPAEPEPAAT